MPLTPDKINTWNELKVKEYFLTEHNPCEIDLPQVELPATPLGVTVHKFPSMDVERTTVAELYTRATMDNRMGDVRVHFYVDNICAWQNLPLNLSSWHANDGELGIGNTKTISVVIIGEDEKAENNAVKLISYLFKKYDFGLNNLFTHAHWVNIANGVTGDNDYLNTAPTNSINCGLSNWNSFKEKIQQAIKPAVKQELTMPEVYRVRKSWTNVKSQIGAFNNIEYAKKVCKPGYKVFNSKGVIVFSVEGEAEETKQIDVQYQAYSDYHWLPQTINCESYAGIIGYPIRAFAAKTSEGHLYYRVHLLGGGWLNWIHQLDLKDLFNGYAGILSSDIDAIQLYFTGDEDYEVRYRVSQKNEDYYPWVIGLDAYAGVFGKQIDRIQMEIIKKQKEG